jgi:hypothetical protein
MSATEFIFMLTRDDRTSADAPALAETALSCGVRHIGFKDVGLGFDELGRLAQLLRHGGATTYLEIVSLSLEAERDSIAAGLDLGVDNILGGVHAAELAAMFDGRSVGYFPFAGRVEDHPGRLAGPPQETATSARRLCALPQVTGLDLLAWRGPPKAGASLARRICRESPKPVIVAGSIGHPRRIASVLEAGAFAFTIGTAVLEARFDRRDPSLPAQFRAVERARRRAAERLAQAAA